MRLRIKEVAKRKGMTFMQIADKINTDKTTISRYNSGNVVPPLYKLQLIADALDTEISELLPLGKNYRHWELDGEWLGIRKKH